MDKSLAVLRDILSSAGKDYQVSDIRTCIYWTAVTSLHCGLASTMAYLCPPTEGNQVVRAGELLPAGAKALAELSFSSRTLEASIGIAALNSMLPFNEARCIELNAEIEILSRGTGKRIAIIGHFPFVKRLLGKAKKLWVFELPGRERQGDLVKGEIDELLPQADVVAVTSTTLINHTLGSILDLISPDAYKIILGPSTPLSPVFFDYGFDAISGSIVVDREQALNGISQGANFQQVRGVRKVIIRRGNN